MESLNSLKVEVETELYKRIKSFEVARLYHTTYKYVLDFVLEEEPISFYVTGPLIPDSTS